MSETTTHFWLDWGVQLLVALGTLGAVYAALFGDSFKAARVRLYAWIENEKGVFTPTVEDVIRETAGGFPVVTGRKKSAARYYQLRVRNGSKRFAAHRVDVWLVRVDRYNKDDTIETWRGELPMIWQHHWNIPGPRTIGNAANADIFAISADRVLTLQTLIPALERPGPYREGCELLVTVQVRCDEVVLDDIHIRVEWDGEWHKDADEMQVVFEVIEQPGGG